MKPEKMSPSFPLSTMVENTICAKIEGRSSVPFYVVDVDDILMKFKSWQLNMPRVKPFYSVRANDTRVVIETLAGLGVGFHCTNRSEIENVLATDISPKDIINGTPLKTNSALRHSWSKGVDLVTVDSEHDLRRIAATNSEARIMLKLRVDGTDDLGCKMSADREQCRALLSYARENQLKVVGVAFHIASGYNHPAYYPAAIAEAAQVFCMALEFGYEMNMLNIGGGFPATADASFEDMCTMINESLDVYFPHVEGSNFTIIAEPGRYFVATAFTLVDRVAEYNSLITQNEAKLGSYGYTLLEQAISDENNCNEITGGSSSFEDETYMKSVILPEETGEWMVLPDMGAYTIAKVSPLNGFWQPELHLCFSEFTINKLRVAFNWHQIAKTLGLDDKIGGDIADERLSANESRLHRQLSQLIDVN